MSKNTKRNSNAYTLIKGQLNDWAEIDKRSFAAHTCGTGDGREKKWLRYESRLIGLGYPPEVIVEKYHQKALRQSRLFDAMVICCIALTLLSNLHTHQNAPEISGTVAFFGIAGSLYLVRKYIKKSDGGFLGYRSWINLVARY